jgi:hypothetical protein
MIIESGPLREWGEIFSALDELDRRFAADILAVRLPHGWKAQPGYSVERITEIGRALLTTTDGGVRRKEISRGRHHGEVLILFEGGFLAIIGGSDVAVGYIGAVTAPVSAFEGPPPGSPEAVRGGCICPVMDNAHGKGIGGDGESHGWWITDGCPLHVHVAKPA